jgi:3-oxoadipate enol-lactonase
VNVAYAEVNGTRLYYEVAGSGASIVLIHGLGTDSSFWDLQFELFAKSYQVIRYDTRGHGRSALPTDEPYSHTEDLKALLDHLGIAQATLVGQSMGGGIAIDFALAFPERTTRLVLAEPGLDGYAWPPEWDATWEPVANAFASEGSRAALEQLLVHPLMAFTFEQPEPRARLLEIFSNYSGWHFVNADPVIVADPPAIQRLDEIRVPVLVFIGEQDVSHFHNIAGTLAQHLPDVQRVELAGVGHVVPLEAPEKFNGGVLHFLESL